MKTQKELRALIDQMTMEEKIGQLVQYNANVFTDTSQEATGPAAELGAKPEFLPVVGSSLNFQGADEMIRIQDEHLAGDRNKIPMIFMMDVIHGFRTIFPIPLGMGASFDEKLVEECTRMASKEAAAGGVQVSFTPMVDYARDARWGRVMETCGEEPLINGIMGAAQIRAFQGDDLSSPDSLGTCVKHFAAYGGAEAGRDYNTVEISERLLREYYLPAYKACLDAGATMIMPSFNSLNGVPSVANKWLMKKVLRDEWGFDGVVISDYYAIGELVLHGITDNLKDAAAMAFDCGCHMEMMSVGYQSHLKELIEEGKFTVEQLDDAVMRVLKLKNDLGLFDDPYHGASSAKEAAVCLSPEHRALAKKAAEKCAVLLKNNGVLPLDKETKRIALIGPFADEKAIKGFWACCGEDKDCVTVAEGIRALCPDAEVTVVKGCSALWDDKDTSGFAEAVKAAEAADTVILCVGEPQNYSGEGNSRADIGLPGLQTALVKEVAAANANNAMLLFTGRPLVLTDVEKSVGAILNMWFPGTEGGSAAASLLFGEANPSGKITMSFPKAVGQCPIYYNHPSTGRAKQTPEEVHQIYASNYIGCGNLPLYSFGHGLSYSNFVYEGFEIDSDTLTADGKITATVTVTNDSDRAGEEVVQLYMHDLFASAVRPIQQLIAFEKAAFAPHETKTITFEVREDMLRFYNAECEFVSEPGDFDLMVGYADHFAFTKRFKLV
ncbi:MAG: beta-glucosidase BglX [Lachnospiraceae bacterium]|nr:beta-glucosidase BglX [Lachnospiraceae bacterium]